MARCVIITSQDSQASRLLGGKVGVVVVVDVMETEEAVAMLHSNMDENSAEVSDEMTTLSKQIVGLLDRLPLAVELDGTRIKAGIDDGEETMAAMAAICLRLRAAPRSSSSQQRVSTHEPEQENNMESVGDESGGAEGSEPKSDGDQLSSDAWATLITRPRKRSGRALPTSEPRTGGSRRGDGDCTAAVAPKCAEHWHRWQVGRLLLPRECTSASTIWIAPAGRGGMDGSKHARSGAVAGEARGRYREM